MMSSIQLPINGLGRKHHPFWMTSALLVVAVILSPEAGRTQQAPLPSQAAPASPAKKTPRHRNPAAQAEPAPQPTQETAAPAPEVPKWPVNDSPAKPAVTWDSSGLKIEANNSSLHDILTQVSADTGAKVEGMGSDERVFGQYGPGAARDVISQLLHGSSYNVLLIGDQGAGTPRQIVLSARREGTNQSPQPQVENPVDPQDQPDEDIPDQPEDMDQSNQQPPMMNGRPPMQMQGPNGAPPEVQGAPRTPQQVLQELQQRQQQMQDQQQQQQPQ
jgi:hypothetical protein